MLWYQNSIQGDRLRLGCLLKKLWDCFVQLLVLVVWGLNPLNIHTQPANPYKNELRAFV